MFYINYKNSYFLTYENSKQEDDYNKITITSPN